MNIFAALGAIRARVAGVVGSLAVVVGASAGPMGKVFYVGFDPVTKIATYDVWDPDGIDQITVFGGVGGGVLQQIPCTCEQHHFVEINWAADAGRKWESITWTDCQTKAGHKRNHAHSWRVFEDPATDGLPKDKTVYRDLCNGNANQPGFFACQDFPYGATGVSVGVSGLTPNTAYEVWVQTNVNGGTSVPGTMLLPKPLVTGPTGEGVVTEMIMMSIQSVQGLSIRRGGPSGTVYASGFDWDFDDDGVRNMLDNAPYSTNPDQLDSNGDGVGDRADCNDDGQDDYNQVNNGSDDDLNHNGVVDACEKPACPTDYNGDGFSNGDDFDAFVVDFALGC